MAKKKCDRCREDALIVVNDLQYYCGKCALDLAMMKERLSKDGNKGYGNGFRGGKSFDVPEQGWYNSKA